MPYLAKHECLQLHRHGIALPVYNIFKAIEKKDPAQQKEAYSCTRSLQIVIVDDDDDRENEGDLIMAAELATPEAMAFIVNRGN
ncbi:hypothetical protein C5167_004225 [Papaver somniferum]|nr:hypothetical protein C5167_004225 [Papaver somniferum]